MADPWPLDLPQSQFVGLTQQYDDSVLRTGMDAGPPSRRNRYTAISQSLEIPIIMTGAQKISFDTFYRDTLAHGAKEFTWEDPTTDQSIDMAFKKPVRFTMTRGGTGPDDRIWRGTMELEIQP